MARSRNLKPGFFKNELLAECPPLARLLFAGLWCVADRDGRLEDRPKRLKVEILPYDDCNADELLAALASRRFIERYTVEDAAYIRIPAFARHQNPHHRETASTVPAAPLIGTADVAAPCAGQVQPRPAKDKPEVSPGLAHGEAATGHGSAVLIPDSPLPITDSMQVQSPASDGIAEKEPKTKDADLFPGVTKDVIRDFRSIRKAKKAPITETAMDEIKREAANAGLSLHDALVMCCARGWGGFEASWLSGTGRRIVANEPSRLPELTA